MNLPAIILSTLLFAPQLLVVHYGTSIRASVDGQHPTLNECAKGGLEVRYQFQFQVCRRRGLWFDACKSVRDERNSFRLDPISEAFLMVQDRLDDGKEPTKVQVDSLKAAFALAGSSSKIPLSFLAQDDNELLNSPKMYVDVRASTYCKEEYSPMLSRLTGVFTLGLVDLKPFDSGWKKYVFTARPAVYNDSPSH